MNINLRDPANLVEIPFCVDNCSTHRLNLLVPGGSYGRNIWLPRRWREPCCHPHWCYQKPLHQSHHHKAHLLALRRAWHHQVHLFHHPLHPPHCIPGADPTVQKKKKNPHSLWCLSYSFIFKCVISHILSWGHRGNSPVYLEGGKQQGS